MAESKPHKDAMVWMSGDYSVPDLHFRRAIIREKLSMVTHTTIEFQSKNKAVQLGDLVGKLMRVHVKTEAEAERIFPGLCISVENLGFRDGFGQYVAEVRPWFWLLQRTKNSRIFQDMTVPDIIKEVFSEHGFSDFSDKLTETYDTLTYCVQYRESDFDFVCRLMEQEGIYYFFDNGLGSTAVEDMILCDSISAHQAAPEKSSIEFHARDVSDRRREDHITEWAAENTLTTGKVSLDDFDFTAPTSDLTVANVQRRGQHKYAALEIYDAPGRHRNDGAGPQAELSRGEKLARVRLEAEVVNHSKMRGASGVRTLGTGMTFKLTDHPTKLYNAEYLVTESEHCVQVLTDVRDHGVPHDLQPRNMDYPENAKKSAYSCVLGAIPKRVPFRAPLNTAWPEIAGMHTATVVGPRGEEIYTDKYGRIKVKFHWDRDRKKNETSSCWVRVVTPWSGKNWGMIAIPRIDQEVAIQFEEGDPDRPICTGMLYNEETMPPYALPDNKTQSGIRTDSSKDVRDAKAYNELMFEDKKDAELVRVQAQKDHEMLVKDKSSITIGFNKMDFGPHDGDFSLSTVIKQNVSQTITDGDRFVKIEKGSETIDIKKDKTQTIEGKQTKTVTLDDTTTIKRGDMTTTVKLGDISVKASLGKIAMQAMKEISLKVGASTITIKPAEVSIKSPMIKIQANAMAEMKAPLTTVKGDAMLTLKGGITMIN